MTRFDPLLELDRTIGVDDTTRVETGANLGPSFRVQGIPFVFFAISGIVQSTLLIQRLWRQLQSSQKSPRLPRITDVHLFLGRVGILLLSAGTCLDNLRHFTSSFSFSWPNTIWTSPNARGATELWKQDDYRGAPLPSSLFWICQFLHLVMSPLAIYSVLYILRVGLRMRLPSEARLLPSQLSDSVWFWLSTSAVVHLMLTGLFGFLAVYSGPLKVRHVTGVIALDSAWHVPLLLKGLLGVILWQSLLLISQLTLCVFDGKENRQSNFFMLLVNIVSFLMQAIPKRSEEHECYRLMMINFAEQIAVATQIWADALYSGGGDLVGNKTTSADHGDDDDGARDRFARKIRTAHTSGISKSNTPKYD